MSSEKTLGEKLQSIPKGVLYLVLILACAVPLFLNKRLPNKPVDSSLDLYAALGSLKEGSTVLISSDWTNSTRAENGSDMDVLLKLLMRRKVKFAVYSIADANATEVAKNEIAAINEERVKNGEEPYKRWRDWVDLGFYPNGEGTATSMTVSVKEAFAGRKDINEQSQSEDVFDSPVLKNVSKLSDVAMVVNVTGSNTYRNYVQRLSGKVPICCLVTGVMGPESFNYYASGQITGLAIGIKGVYDMECLLEAGVNVEGSPYHSTRINDPAPGYPGASNYGKGALFYPSLHAGLFTLILAVIIGNVGMFMARRKTS